MDKLDDLLKKIEKEEKNTKHLKKEFEDLSRRDKTLPSTRLLVERWRDLAWAWMETSKKLLYLPATDATGATDRSEMSKSVREATKAYAEATKALTMIPPILEHVNQSIRDYFTNNYQEIIPSFLEKKKPFKEILEAYIKFNPESMEMWEEKLGIVTKWKSGLTDSLQNWKKNTKATNPTVNKEYLDELIFPSIEQTDTAVMDTVNGLKAFNMVIEEEEKQNIKSLKAETQALQHGFRTAFQIHEKKFPYHVNEKAIKWKEKATQLVSAIRKRLEKKTLSEAEKESLTRQLKFSEKALQAADSNIGLVFRDEQDKEVGEDSQKKRVASTTVDDLNKEWWRSKQLYQGSDFQNKTLQERMRIILELFNNANLFLKNISRQMDDQLYTQVQNSKKTARQVYEKLKEEVKKAQKEDDGEEEEQEEEDNDIQLLPYHPPQPQSFGPSSVGWYTVMVVLFIL